MRIQDPSFDLGRLYMLLNKLCEDEIFELFDRFSKHYTIEEYMGTIDEEKKSDFLWEVQCKVKRLEELILECCLIAKGCDSMNELPDEFYNN